MKPRDPQASIWLVLPVESVIDVQIGEVLTPFKYMRTTLTYEDPISPEVTHMAVLDCWLNGAQRGDDFRHPRYWGVSAYLRKVVADRRAAPE